MPILGPQAVSAIGRGYPQKGRYSGESDGDQFVHGQFFYNNPDRQCRLHDREVVLASKVDRLLGDLFFDFEIFTVVLDLH